MLKFRLRKTILGKFQSLGEILEFILLPFVELHHIGQIFFPFLNPFRPASQAYPTHTHMIQLPVGGRGWGRKSTGHFAQDPGLTGGFGHLLPTLGSHPLRSLRHKAPWRARDPASPSHDPGEGWWRQGSGAGDHQDHSRPKPNPCHGPPRAPQEEHIGAGRHRMPSQEAPGCTPSFGLCQAFLTSRSAGRRRGSRKEGCRRAAHRLAAWELQTAKSQEKGSP